MKILAVSDRVIEHIYSPTIRRRYADVELVLGCGDLPFYYLEYIVTMLTGTPVFYVRGNHDDQPHHMSDGRVVTRAEGCTDIDGIGIKHAGLLIAGIEGSMRYRPDGKCMYTDSEIAFKLLRLVPWLIANRARHGRWLDILVAHSPPYGIHDRSDLAHTGFRSFLSFMRRFRPRYLLHGHVHDYEPTAIAQSRYHDTFVINVYPFVTLDIPLIQARKRQRESSRRET